MHPVNRCSAAASQATQRHVCVHPWCFTTALLTFNFSAVVFWDEFVCNTPVWKKEKKRKEEEVFLSSVQGDWHWEILQCAAVTEEYYYSDIVIVKQTHTLTHTHIHTHTHPHSGMRTPSDLSASSLSAPTDVAQYLGQLVCRWSGQQRLY